MLKSYETIYTNIAEVIKKYPTNIAIISQNRAYKYYELNEAIFNVKSTLTRLGIEKGCKVIIHGSSSFGFFTAFLASGFVGATVVPLDAGLPIDRQTQILSTVGPDLFFSTEQTEISASLSNCARISISPNDANMKILSDKVQKKDINPKTQQNAAYIFFSSGSTGKPKGILGCHEGLSHFIDWQKEQFKVTPDDRVSQLSGLSFDVMLRDPFLPLSSGAALVIPDRSDIRTGQSALRWLRQHAISRIHIVPTIAQKWVSSIHDSPMVDSLKTVFFAGEPLLQRLVEAWITKVCSKGDVVNLYGPTETSLAKFYHIISPDNIANGIQPVGKPLPKCNYWFHNNGEKHPTSGEIIIQTPFVPIGYLNDPDQTSKKFKYASTPEGELMTYATGDLGYIDQDSGLLFLNGRLDNQVKINGVRIEIEELESLLYEHPAIENVAIISHKQTNENNTLIAFWTRKKNLQIDNKSIQQEFRALLSKKLSLSIIPSRFIEIWSLPLLPNGKLDRKSLVPLVNEFAIEEIEEAYPSNLLQARLLPIWQRVLKHENAVYSNFFTAGGSSLEAEELLLLIEETFGVHIRLDEFFHEPTFSYLSSLIEKLKSTTPSVSKSDTDATKLLKFNDAVLFPLTPAQEAFYRFHVKGHNSNWNNIVRSYLVSTCKNPKIAFDIKQALDRIVDKHAALRTVFVAEQKSINQKIITFLDFKYILSQQSGSYEEYQERIDNLHSVKLDPFLSPMWLAEIFTLPDGSSYLLFCAHHLISDGVSQDILGEELLGLLENSDSINTSGYDYKNIITDLTSTRYTTSWEKSLTYWKDFFRREGNNSENYHNFSHQTDCIGSAYSVCLDQNSSLIIKKIARQCGVSPFVIMLTSYFETLHRYYAKKLILVSILATGRVNKELEKTIGNFATVVHVKSHQEKKLRLYERFHQSSQQVALALRHQYCQFAEVLDALNVDISGSRIPLSSIFLNYLGEPSTPPTLKSIGQRNLPFDVKFDLMTYIWISDNCFFLDFHYRKSLFDQEIFPLASIFLSVLQEVKDEYLSLSIA